MRYIKKRKKRGHYKKRESWIINIRIEFKYRLNNGVFNKLSKYNNLRRLISSSRGCFGIHFSSDSIWLRGECVDDFLFVVEIPGIIEPNARVEEDEIAFSELKDESEEIDGNDDEDDEHPGVEGPIWGGSFAIEKGEYSSISEIPCKIDSRRIAFKATIVLTIERNSIIYSQNKVLKGEKNN